MENQQVVVNLDTGEIIGPAFVNTAGSLTRGNGVIHVGCAQAMNYARVSDTSAALFCPRCGLRVVFPVAVTTFGELDAHFKSVAKAD